MYIWREIRFYSIYVYISRTLLNLNPSYVYRRDINIEDKRIECVRFLSSAYNWAGFINAMRCANEWELATGGPGQINMDTCVRANIWIPSTFSHDRLTISATALSYREKTCPLSSRPADSMFSFYFLPLTKGASDISRWYFVTGIYRGLSGDLSWR